MPASAAFLAALALASLAGFAKEHNESKIESQDILLGNDLGGKGRTLGGRSLALRRLGGGHLYD